MISIIDCGIGNLRSICNAIEKLKQENKIKETYLLTNDKDTIENSNMIILPGVGEFGTMMNELRKSKLDKVIINSVKKGTKILGICLGMQMMFSFSEESPGVKGLNLFNGIIRKFASNRIKVPQMGWNNIYSENLTNYVYFANSYCLKEKEDDYEIVFYSNYDTNFISGIRKDNITAYQFHPEKSGELGLSLLKDWINNTNDSLKFDIFNNEEDIVRNITEIKDSNFNNQLTKRIIPCLDVCLGNVVKGKSFQDLKVIGDAVELAKKYYKEGADELVFLDITASDEKRKTVFDLVKNVAKEIFIPFTVGGGISRIEDIRDVLLSGADKVSLNTSAVIYPSLVLEASKRYGNQCVVVAIDAKRNEKSWTVMIKGGKEETNLDAIMWAKEAERLGAGELLITSIDKDGQCNGYDLDLLSSISKVVNIPVIASGGFGKLKDAKIMFNETNSDACLAASIFHYERFNIREVKDYLKLNKIKVR
jgi:imidazole glycerol-phosphate synthase subunit HisF